MAEDKENKKGEIEKREDVTSSDEIEAALDQKIISARLTQQLSKLGYIEESELTHLLAQQYGVPAVNLLEFELDPEVVQIIPRDMAQRYKVIPIQKTENSLIVAMADPSNIIAIDDLRFRTGMNIEPVVATEEAIMSAIEKYYGGEEEETGAPATRMEEIISQLEDESLELIESEEEIDAKQLEEMAEEAPVVKLVNLIITDAINKGASDIHLEPQEKGFRVRYRIDGILHKVMDPPKKLQNAIISRVKIMANMDIAERRLPQDGRIKLKTSKGKEIDFRVSSLPTIYGEKVVLRILDKESLQIDMTKLGYEDEQLRIVREELHKPWGMILDTGPTGSGKTTTLYSSLMELNSPEVNISTAEDPVEYTLKGINQVQMHDAIGLNFATALRAFLRQDPDIILVGEIRDYETAEIAVKAALTGHLVLSTLHTNDAPSSINRLVNMGIEPFLITASVLLIQAQRLVRKICPYCKDEIKVSPQVLRQIQVPEELIEQEPQIFKGKGCARCNYTGYKGRIAVFEVMPLREEIKELILTGASASELKREAIRLGMKTMRQAAITKLLQGITTIEEVVRVTSPD